MLRRNLLNIYKTHTRNISERVKRTLLQDLDSKKGKNHSNHC
jgi:hypothetical protein